MESLYAILLSTDLAGPEPETRFRELEQAHGSVVYSELIYLMSHLRFASEQARLHWERIVEHRHFMAERLASSVDLRVATASYFVQIQRELKHPKIIEMQQFDQTRASVYRDELTGLHNFRFFTESIAREIAQCGRCNSALSLVMLDVDNFKHYNDCNGHEAGNEVLARVAEILVASVRTSDLATRYGGEEFCLILPSTPKTGARRVAERVRCAIEGHDFPHGEYQPMGRLTVSQGIATYPADATEPSELVRRADRALYSAKGMGRNQVQLYGCSSRSFRRIDVSLDGRFQPLADGSHTMQVREISEGGLLFAARRPPSIGSLIEIRLTLPGSEDPLPLTGRVVDARTGSEGEFEVAVRTLEISPADKSRLMDHLGPIVSLES